MEGMKLEEFVSAALTQVVAGVKAARAIHPQIATEQSFLTPMTHQTTVVFDIAVEIGTTESGKATAGSGGGNGGFELTVPFIDAKVSLSADAKAGQEEYGQTRSRSSASRVKFEVPLDLRLNDMGAAKQIKEARTAHSYGIGLNPDYDPLDH